MTPFLSLGRISMKKTIASEFGKIRCELSTKRISFSSKSSIILRSIFSKGSRMTWSARLSISARGFGSIEMILVFSSCSCFALKATFVELPDPISMYFFGL